MTSPMERLTYHLLCMSADATSRHDTSGRVWYQVKQWKNPGLLWQIAMQAAQVGHAAL